MFFVVPYIMPLKNDIKQRSSIRFFVAGKGGRILLLESVWILWILACVVKIYAQRKKSTPSPTHIFLVVRKNDVPLAVEALSLVGEMSESWHLPPT